MFLELPPPDANRDPAPYIYHHLPSHSGSIECAGADKDSSRILTNRTDLRITLLYLIYVQTHFVLHTQITLVIEQRA